MWMFKFLWFFVVASFSNPRLLSKANGMAVQPLDQPPSEPWQWPLSILLTGWNLEKVYCVVFHFNTPPIHSTQYYIGWGWKTKLWKMQSDSHILSVKLISPLEFLGKILLTWHLKTLQVSACLLPPVTETCTQMLYCMLTTHKYKIG